MVSGMSLVSLVTDNTDLNAFLASAWLRGGDVQPEEVCPSELGEGHTIEGCTWCLLLNTVEFLSTKLSEFDTAGSRQAFFAHVSEGNVKDILAYQSRVHRAIALLNIINSTATDLVWGSFPSGAEQQ